MNFARYLKIYFIILIIPREDAVVNIIEYLYFNLEYLIDLIELPKLVKPTDHQKTNITFRKR